MLAKKVVYAATLAGGILISALVVRAVGGLQTQREAMLAAVKAAIERGDEHIGPVDGMIFLPDLDSKEGKEDDPIMRQLWTRMQQGPRGADYAQQLLSE